MVLQVRPLISQEVNKCTLLHKIVLIVKSHVIHLFLRVSQVNRLLLLTSVGPLRTELLHLIVAVNVVEDGEFGTGQPMEVADLGPTEVETNHELVVEDHASDPLVVGPAAKFGDGGD